MRPFGVGNVRILLVLAHAVLVLGACAQTPPTRFYTLNPLLAPADRPAPNKAYAIGVEPVRLPAYLDRLQIVTRSTPTQITLGEFDTWAEPLDGMVTQTLSENILHLAGARSVVRLPQHRDTKIDRIVDVVVHRFDCESGAAVLLADWRIFDSRDRQIAGRRFEGHTPVSPPGDYPAMVAGKETLPSVPAVAPSWVTNSRCARIARVHHGLELPQDFILADHQLLDLSDKLRRSVIRHQPAPLGEPVLFR
jgi:hypothetical protein